MKLRLGLGFNRYTQTGLRFLFANGEAGASWNVLGYSVIGEAITSITDSSGNDITLANAVTAQQPAYDETEDGIKYAFFDLDDSLSATLPDLGTDASKWTVTPYAVHIETGQTIGAGSYTAPTNDWGAHGVIDREVTATEVNRIVSWAKRNKLTGVDYPTLKTRMDVICMNAVDVFVYDTTQDSDGGAWRTGDLAQASSWYNETLNTATRGSRREFPAMAVIVAESNKVTIYDGDDPALPMWRVLLRDTVSTDISKAWWRSSSVIKAGSVSALNGKICIGLLGAASANCGVAVADFPNDDLSHYSSASNISNRGLPIVATGSDIALPINLGVSIVSFIVNDVAMTVLPDAPIDPATGLPVPTIAVATDGGVSVIRHDGTVVDSSQLVAMDAVYFSENGLWFSGATKTRLFFANYDDLAANGFAPLQVGDTDNINGDFALLARPEKVTVGSTGVSIASSDGFQNAVSGLMLHQPNYTDQSKGMSALLTSTYNTGWMNGDIKGAFLADTDDTDLVGSGELVTNGTFDTDTSGWTGLGDGSTITFSSGAALVESNGDYGAAYQEMTLEVGKAYVVSGSVNQGSSKARIRFGNPANASSWMNLPTSNDFSYTIVPTTPQAFLTLGTQDPSGTCTFDNISVKLADADRSVNNKGLIVNGTITREPVAPGAELVAYSGFSASNYLEQPYNPDLDFGTGDFCVMGWVNVPDAVSSFRSFERNNLASPDATKRIVVNVTGGLVGAYAGSTAITSAVTAGVWNYVAAVRSGGVFYLYVNGVQKASQTNTLDLSLSSAITRLGSGVQYAGANHSLALMRISATAPTAEQIAKIYEDELPLFQEKAACTLAGSGDAVTALAHDPTTGVLRAAQSDKTSLFVGLERVGEEDGKATCIASSNGIVAGI